MYAGICPIRTKAVLFLKAPVRGQADLNPPTCLRQGNGLKNYDLPAKNCCNLEYVVLQ